MTKHHVDIVDILKGCRIVQNLLEVVVIRTLVIFLYRTACRIKLTIVGVEHIGITCLVQIGRTIQGERQAWIERQVCKTIGCKGVSL